MMKKTTLFVNGMVLGLGLLVASSGYAAPQGQVPGGGPGQIEDPIPIECPEDPCQIMVGDELFCADPATFCDDTTDDELDMFLTPHAWTEADIDLFIASVEEGDTDGDITQAAYDELRTLLEAGGTIDDITAWFIVYFDQGSLFQGDGAGDTITAAACRQACRRLPGVLPSQCRKICKRLSSTTRVGFKSLCEHMERHREKGWKLCWKIYNALWPQDNFWDFPEEDVNYSRP